MPKIEALIHEVMREFLPHVEHFAIEQLRAGHINDTFFIDAGSARFVLQRINAVVFADPWRLVSNTQTVSDWVRQRALLVPKQVSTKRGAPGAQDAEGAWWRLTERIADARSFDAPPSRASVYAAAQAFGELQHQLRDFPQLSELVPAIPGFHDLNLRLAAFDTALGQDTHGRAAGIAADINDVLASIAFLRERLQQSAFDALPRRLIHADAKFNNVLFDGNNVVRALVDLDTVMPNAAVYDPGDFIRSAANTTVEDAVDVTTVHLRTDYVDAAIAGYRSAMDDVLNDHERQLLLPASAYMALMLGVRFATDYLDGDVYFKTHRPAQNLDRARTQLRLAVLLAEYD